MALVSDLIETAKLESMELGLISVHHEKAFDWVEHPYLWRTLKKSGFNPAFVTKFQTLYQDTESILK